MAQEEQHLTRTQLRWVKMFCERSEAHEGKATIEFDERWPDGYRIEIEKINEDGTFTARLVEVAPCI